MAASHVKSGRPRGLAWVVAGAMLIGPYALQAADFPASGDAAFDRYVTAKVVGSVDSPVGKGIVWEDVGLTRNVRGEAPWDRLVDRCLGTATVIGEDWTRMSGTCVKKDQDGDQIFVTWQGDDWTVVGGTGKYQGITGNGTTSFDFKKDSLEERPDGWVSILHHTVTWQIKPTSSASAP